ncbi:MAG: beta-galactosidase [Anaerolineae bacterium]|nr:beta-galactosidase [Anaerolineae bacterium]
MIRHVETICKLFPILKELLPWLTLSLLPLFLLSPPGILVTLDAPQQVQTTNPKVGVHTRLSDEVEEWKIQRTLALVREMGAAWSVEYFPWTYIESDEDRYDWRHSDLIIKHAANQGVQVIARLGMVPRWARPDPAGQETTDTHLEAEHYADFAEFVAEFAARYRGEVTHLIIWNEPNLSFEWGYRPVDPAGYAELLAAVYPAAHAANSEVIILGGALAPTLEPEGGHAGLNDLLYLEKMYQAGAAAHFDALAAHAYGLVFPPEMPPAPELLNFRRVELLREIMVAQGDGAKDIYVTESGWNDHPRWAWAVTPSQRIQYTLSAYQWAADEWPWSPLVASWVFRTPASAHNYQDYFSFVTPDFRPRPIYELAQSELRVDR